MPIDRSIPLPIHEPAPTMIRKVAELKKLYATEAAPLYSDTGDEFTYECAALNALPEMLTILGEIRSGDAEILHWMITGEGDDPTQDEINEMLGRYHEMAAKMEAKSK